VQVDSSVIEGKYLQDILDHPRALENTLASLQENPSLGELTARLRKGNFTTLVLTGMGSSFHALHPLQAISSLLLLALFLMPTGFTGLGNRYVSCQTIERRSTTHPVRASQDSRPKPATSHELPDDQCARSPSTVE
jgi:hypothetical protein